MLQAETLEQLFDEVTRAAVDLFVAEGASLQVVVEEGRFLKVMAGRGTFSGQNGHAAPLGSLTGTDGFWPTIAGSSSRTSPPIPGAFRPEGAPGRGPPRGARPDPLVGRWCSA